MIIIKMIQFETTLSEVLQEEKYYHNLLINNMNDNSLERSLRILNYPKTIKTLASEIGYINLGSYPKYNLQIKQFEYACEKDDYLIAIKLYKFIKEAKLMNTMDIFLLAMHNKNKQIAKMIYKITYMLYSLDPIKFGEYIHKK